jgi:hypothetical protein
MAGARWPVLRSLAMASATLPRHGRCYAPSQRPLPSPAEPQRVGRLQRAGALRREAPAGPWHPACQHGTWSAAGAAGPAAPGPDHWQLAACSPRIGPTRIGPARTGPACIGPTRIVPARTGPARTGPARIVPTRIGPARISPTRIGPARIGPTRIGPARIGPTSIGPACVGPVSVGSRPDQHPHRPGTHRPDPYRPGPRPAGNPTHCYRDPVSPPPRLFDSLAALPCSGRPVPSRLPCRRAAGRGLVPSAAKRGWASARRRRGNGAARGPRGRRGGTAEALAPRTRPGRGRERAGESAAQAVLPPWPANRPPAAPRRATGRGRRWAGWAG